MKKRVQVISRPFLSIKAKHLKAYTNFQNDHNFNFPSNFVEKWWPPLDIQRFLPGGGEGVNLSLYNYVRKLCYNIQVINITVK